MTLPVSTMICAGCGYELPPGSPYPFRCPQQDGSDDIDHVLTRVLSTDEIATKKEWKAIFTHPEANPFVKYRKLFHSYHAARAGGLKDAEYVGIVKKLDSAVSKADGRGFEATPLLEHTELAVRLNCPPGAAVWIKDETGNVSGSHKARHLMGLMIWLEIVRKLGIAMVKPGIRPTLSIASCGNAALAAAVVAAAAGYPLNVYVPASAKRSTIQLLKELGAQCTICRRRKNEAGDPCIREFHRSLSRGALPFTVQGSENGLAIEGGETLGWEMISTLIQKKKRLDRLIIQVGGGALAASCIQAFREAREIGLIRSLPIIHTVQTRGAYPLQRAFQGLTKNILERYRRESGESFAIPRGNYERTALIRERVPEVVLDEALYYAVTHRSKFMFPWPVTPKSLAEGILDDETYDWMAVIRGMLLTGGYPVVVSESDLTKAQAVAHRATGIPAGYTGIAGLAGYIRLLRSKETAAGETVALLFTGLDRQDPSAPR
ncbi:MAG: PLP-dependent lyase/thiolase [Candidatus Eisenbacteria bacterium]|uniref:PLP-dependent lyase/thiolase n=1 Tax=Eiseniibacteriota bacterium TaxID=2212470 RepID=A0A948RX16_UNCEI|nr:PLP-dependent lyase/thiolase [Candidatus Eisenbacteria bacterium]MBU1947695.1 PLP-dependent lyase/thiolase [Candidatus Eisenbacteria bacterium]MBU2692061.1 PLP-dependent lyase/thiolase [Candidatus Eisenbacteria bacterium]